MELNVLQHGIHYRPACLDLRQTQCQSLGLVNTLVRWRESSPKFTMTSKRSVEHGCATVPGADHSSRGHDPSMPIVLDPISNGSAW